MSFTKGAEKPDLKLIDADRSHQEFFALPDMQGDGVPACGLVLGEILKGVSPHSGGGIGCLFAWPRRTHRMA